MTAYRSPYGPPDIRLTLTGDGSLAFGYEYVYYDASGDLRVFVHEPTGARRFARRDTETYVGALFKDLLARRDNRLAGFWTPVFDPELPYPA